MENNNPVQTTVPTPTIQPAPVVMPPAESEGSNKMVLWLILGLVAIVLIVGGVYIYFSNQQAIETKVTQQTPAPAAQENLENDLNTIDVTNIDQDFSAIDADLGSL